MFVTNLVDNAISLISIIPYFPYFLRLERIVHNKVRLLWFPDRGGRPLGRGDQQQLPLAVLQLLGRIINNLKGWLAIAKLKPLSLFILLF